jgi:hypothetical protein
MTTGDAAGSARGSAIVSTQGSYFLHSQRAHCALGQGAEQERAFADAS